MSTDQTVAPRPNQLTNADRVRLLEQVKPHRYVVGVLQHNSVKGVPDLVFTKPLRTPRASSAEAKQLRQFLLSRGHANPQVFVVDLESGIIDWNS